MKVEEKKNAGKLLKGTDTKSYQQKDRPEKPGPIGSATGAGLGNGFSGSIFRKLLSDRVLILPDPAEQVTKGGIIIPDSAKEVPARGTIVQVGVGHKDYTMTLKLGDKVLYGKYSGSELEVDGVTYQVMRETEVMAIL